MSVASPRGDARGAFEKAPIQVENEYGSRSSTTTRWNPHASTVIYSDDGKLTIHDKTQGVQNSHKYVVNVFGLSSTDVRVISPFVGGAFGSGYAHAIPALSRRDGGTELKRSVGVVLTRDQMFTFGYRPDTIPDRGAWRQPGRRAPGDHPRGGGGHLAFRGLP